MNGAYPCKKITPDKISSIRCCCTYSLYCLIAQSQYFKIQQPTVHLHYTTMQLQSVTQIRLSLIDMTGQSRVFYLRVFYADSVSYGHQANCPCPDNITSTTRSVIFTPVSNYKYHAQGKKIYLILGCKHMHMIAFFLKGRKYGTGFLQTEDKHQALISVHSLMPGILFPGHQTK